MIQPLSDSSRSTSWCLNESNPVINKLENIRLEAESYDSATFSVELGRVALATFSGFGR